MRLLEDRVSRRVVVGVWRNLHLLAILLLHSNTAVAENRVANAILLLLLDQFLLLLLFLVHDNDAALRLLAGIVAHPEVVDFLQMEERVVSPLAPVRWRPSILVV